MKQCLFLLLGAILSFVGTLHADAVIDWNATATTVMLRVPALARNPNTDMAYVQIAVYDAVNAIDGRYSVFAIAPPNAEPWASKEAATAAAAYRVLVTFYPTQQSYLDSVYATALGGLSNDSTKSRGIAIGDTVATRFLALRAGDGRDASSTYTWMPPGPGVYQPTPPGAAQYMPLNAWLPQLRPLSISSVSLFQAPGPPSLTSDTYTKDFKEVKRLGSRDSTFTTPQQREIARFHTENPSAQLQRNVRLFVASRGGDIAYSARLLAQIWVSIADALTAGFSSKYSYNFWRPSTAIRQADTDGNSLTDQDTSWTPLVNTPPHPEYPAAHGFANGAFAYAVMEFLGTPNVPITLTSTVPGALPQHSFNNINEMLAEIINARVYGGMHFRTSVQDGIELGRQVADWVGRRYFQRLQALPWVAQHSGLLSGPASDIRLAATSETVCWGLKTTANTATNYYMRTTNGGELWTLSSIGQAGGLRGSGIAAIDANTAWIALYDPSGASSGGVFKTTDGGASWSQQTTAFPGSGGNPNFIYFFDSNNGVCVGNPNANLGGIWEIYTTSNGGTSWTLVPSSNIPPPTPSETGFKTFTSVGNRLWFPTGVSQGNGAFYRTTDQGKTWTVNRSVGGVSFLLTFKDSLVGRLSRFSPSNQVLATTDGGDTWSGSGVTAPPWFTSFFITYVKGTEASYVMTSCPGPFGGGSNGSAFSTDGCQTWTLIDNAVARGPSNFASPYAGWCGSANDSVYKWESKLLVTGVTQTKNVAEGFRLEQNYPNPFNPTTNIQFTIVNRQLTIVRVYDVLGRDVATLVNELKEPGTYTVKFDGSNLASGVYVYRLQAGSFVETRKLMLLR